MCGIFGLVQKSSGVKSKLIEGLKFLEYRGYDSAGLSMVDNNQFVNLKAIGKVSELEKEALSSQVDSNIGIGHTRWATHGKVTINNTHPIANNNISLVHNGIVENYLELKEGLLKKYHFYSETDTEVILNLIQYYLDQKLTPIECMRKIRDNVLGNYAIGVIFLKESDKIYCAKNGSPLSIGISSNSIAISSDINTLSLISTHYMTLEDKEIAIVDNESYEIYNICDKKTVKKQKTLSKPENLFLDDRYSSFMEKEISEQSEILHKIYSRYKDLNNHPLSHLNWNKVHKIVITACGSSYNAGLVSKYWFETYAKVNVEVEIASEFRFRDIIYDLNSLYLFISQSGETLDTLSCLKLAKKAGVQTVAMVNATESSIANTADHLIPIDAGIEQSVAATKSFTAQLLQLLMIVFVVSDNKKIFAKDKIIDLKNAISLGLNNLYEIENIRTRINLCGNQLLKTKKIIIIGKKELYPIALEGALKLKELSYLPIFAYPAGELKHGPIALIDNECLVIALVTNNTCKDKMLSAIEEIKARNGKILLISSYQEKKSPMDDNTCIIQSPSIIMDPFYLVITLQWLAYYTTKKLGNDVDKPRNLAKSVTVE